jgi:hypothetical protein
MPGVLTTTLPTEDIYRPRRVLTGPQTPTGRAGGAPGGPPGRAEMGEGARTGGAGGRGGHFSTHPNLSTYPNFSTYPNWPVGGGPKLSTPLPGPPPALCPRAFSDSGRPSHACQPARGGRAHDAVAGVAGVADGLGGWSREIGRISTKSLKWRFRPKKVAHFVWEKTRARTTYIVKECPRKTFCTL